MTHHDSKELAVILFPLGCAEAGVGISAGVYKKPVVVSARKERPNFIIGAGYLAAHDSDLSLRQNFFTVGEHNVECIPEQRES